MRNLCSCCTDNDKRLWMDFLASSMVVGNCLDSLLFHCAFLIPPPEILNRFWETKEALEGQQSAKQLF